MLNIEHRLWSISPPSNCRNLSHKYIFKAVDFIYLLLNEQPNKMGEGRKERREGGKERSKEGKKERKKEEKKMYSIDLLVKKNCKPCLSG